MNNNSENILNFISGTLSPEEEQSLFSQMAYDNELRNDFRCFVNIDKTLKSTSKSFVPSNIVTNDIFSKLGYKIPAIASTGVAFTLSNPNTQPAPKVLFYKSRLFSSIITGIIAVVATVLLMTIDKSANSDGVFPIANITDKKFIKEPSTPVIKNFEQEFPAAPRRRIEQYTSYNRNSNYFKENNAAVNDNTDPSVAATTNDIHTKSLSFSQVNMLPQPKSELLPNNVNDDAPVLLNLSGALSTLTGLSGFSLEVRGAYNWNLPEETIDPKSISKFNNLGITALWKLSEVVEVGADVRQETFFARYYQRGEFNHLYRYDQQPNLTSYCGTFKYFPVMYDSFKPYLQMSAGGNYYGVIARGAAGVEYELLSNVSLMGQVEFSNLFFRHINKWTSSRKIGVNYGVKYSF